MWLFISGCNQTPEALKTVTTVKSTCKPYADHDPVTSSDSGGKDPNTTKPAAERYFYPKMSHCGGALYGIYSDGELIRIESTFGAELGYSSRNVDLKNGRVVKIAYREHFAEWEKYSKKYPDDEGIDPVKMTYSDTLYVWETGSGKTLRKYSGKRLIATAVNEELVDRLFNCIETMKKELASEKTLINE